MSLLKEHGAAFSAIVLAHLKGNMSAAEWASLRQRATGSTPFAPDKARRDLVLIDSPEKLVEIALAEEGFSLKELLDAFGEFSREIGRLESLPVYYFALAGIYAWQPASSEGTTLSIWVTHPAYPPGW